MATSTSPITARLIDRLNDEVEKHPKGSRGSGVACLLDNLQKHLLRRVRPFVTLVVVLLMVLLVSQGVTMAVVLKQAQVSWPPWRPWGAGESAPP